MTTAIIITLTATIVAQHIRYRRLWNQHINTVGALWARDLDVH